MEGSVRNAALLEPMNGDRSPGGGELLGYTSHECEFGPGPLGLELGGGGAHGRIRVVAVQVRAINSFGQALLTPPPVCHTYTSVTPGACIRIFKK